MNRQRSIAKLRRLVESRRLVEARSLCLELTQTHPRDAEIWMMRAGMHFQLGELDAVVECAQRIIAIDGHNAGAYFSLGLALQGLKRVAEAESAYRAALGIQLGHTKALAHLVGLLMEQKRLADAQGLLEAAIEATPQNALLHYNLGLVYLGSGQPGDALRSLEQAVNLNPSMSEGYYHLGLLHYENGEYDTAILCLSRVTTLDLRLVDVYRNIGSTYRVNGRVTDALGIYERLTQTFPEDADAHACAGTCHLLLGDFQRGWPEYEWRLRIKNFMAAPPAEMLRWDGRPLDGKTILIKAEQGYGDTVQFVRYLRDIKVRGGNVILGCQPALVRLLSGCTGADQVANRDELALPHEIEVPLLSLPGIFQTVLETIPADVPYLRVPAGAGTQAIAMIARHDGERRVGLVWAGGAQNPNDHRRSLWLEQLNPLLKVADTKFFSLQKGDAAAQLASLPPGLITDLSPYLGDFADTAAAIQELDLVISVDTAVAHVAGALARPVWTLLPFAPDWRWMLNREDSPWYPTMRLFRQPAPGDWSSVIVRVEAELARLPRKT